MAARWIIGLAPGSSVDGVDAALVELEGTGLEIGLRGQHHLHYPYARDLRNLLGQGDKAGLVEVKQLSLVHRLLGETFAAATRLLTERAGFSLQQVQCVGCPGHGIWLQPDGRFPSVLELGMAAVVAERTGITTVSDFPTRDLAAGGQGILLEALGDHILFRDPMESRLLIHLGGMATVVYLPAGGRVQDIVAFQAGPCGLLLDALMRQFTGGKEAYDPGGKHAVQGRLIDEALEHWLRHPFWQRRPPRCLPPQEFGSDFALQAMQMARQKQWSLHDLLCTATHLVARGIVSSLRAFLPGQRLPDRVLLSGGSVRNGLLWNLLEQQFPGKALSRTDCLGIPTPFRKAIAFGVLAALTLDGIPASLPTVTGSTGARMLGSLTPGSPANWARCLAWMASHATAREQPLRQPLSA